MFPRKAIPSWGGGIVHSRNTPSLIALFHFFPLNYKLDLLLEIKKEIVVKITFLVFIGVLLSSMYAMAVGKLSGEMINELFSIVNGIMVR